jgi:hypothetical protein
MIEFLFALFGWSTRYHISLMYVENGCEVYYRDCIIIQRPWFSEDNYKRLPEELRYFYKATSKPTILSIYKL